MSVASSHRDVLFLNATASAETGRTTPPRRRRRWIRILLVVFAALFVLDYGLSFSLEAGWLHRSFTARLEAAFGRPVEVSNYSFSLLEGPRLEADYVTVAEDPRFGHEYFLRADQVTAGLAGTGQAAVRMSLHYRRADLGREPEGGGVAFAGLIGGTCPEQNVAEAVERVGLQNRIADLARDD